MDSNALSRIFFSILKNPYKIVCKFSFQRFYSKNCFFSSYWKTSNKIVFELCLNDRSSFVQKSLLQITKYNILISRKLHKSTYKQKCLYLSVGPYKSLTIIHTCHYDENRVRSHQPPCEFNVRSCISSCIYYVNFDVSRHLKH